MERKEGDRLQLRDGGVLLDLKAQQERNEGVSDRYEDESSSPVFESTSRWRERKWEGGKAGGKEGLCDTHERLVP